MGRLFVAVWPSQDVIEGLRELPRKDRPGISWVPPENWHITLRFLGEADPDEVSGRLDELDFEPIQIRYGPGIDVLNERVIVAPVHGLEEHAARINAVLNGVGSQPARKRFNGHLTLARLKRRPPPRLRVVGTPFSASQRVDSIALIESRLRPAGATYETIETWIAV